jgi:hypothetical protein
MSATAHKLVYDEHIEHCSHTVAILSLLKNGFGKNVHFDEQIKFQ